MSYSYVISYKKPHNHYIDIEFIADTKGKDEIIVQLPAWRPGRYELGNFAKNIQKWTVVDGFGKPLKFHKISKDSWKIYTKDVECINIIYNYYAVDLNAGSTYLDATQLYVNPVNCCVYIPDQINEPCDLLLHVPENYIIACGVPSYPNGASYLFGFKDFHELADSPFIASATLQHNKFNCSDKEFNIWFQGECKPDWTKLINDFTKFCNHQMEMMKQAPFESYHFLFQILPTRMYHGVEHTTSTVCALGPGYNLMKGELYENFLGVSCHELFHAWNIKTIRPIEMQPYDYTKENYSKLGYVCEGVTTYYGDYLLYRCGVFSESDYLKTFDERLQKHFDNFGRFNLSVADSSFDTWLDGYAPGIPNRKTNIYDEGNLLAFVTDMFIRKNSKNKNSLDDVMRHLYNEFALKNKGYSDIDYKEVVEQYAGTSYDDIFNNYINGKADYEPLLRDTMNYIGCELKIESASKYNEHALGLKVNGVEGICKVTAVYLNSVADVAGIGINDDVLSINGMQVKPDASGTNFTEWCNYFGQNSPLVKGARPARTYPFDTGGGIVPLQITFSSNGIIKSANINPQPGAFYKIIKMQKQAKASEDQKNNFELWSNNKF